MAVFNIIGDMGYLGYAFAAEGFVSIPKLIGASITMFAHVLLLAYGDDQARVIAAEQGWPSRLFFALRMRAQRMVAGWPLGLQRLIRARTVGISFTLLAFNGIAFMADGWARLEAEFSLSMADQLVMGMCITLGTGAFAAADFVRQQRLADFLTRVAPTLLTLASALNVVLAVTTVNPFVILSVVAFAVSNLAGFFTSLDKSKNAQDNAI